MYQNSKIYGGQNAASASRFLKKSRNFRQSAPMAFTPKISEFFFSITAWQFAVLAFTALLHFSDTFKFWA
jgi:hypothetical protein